MSGIENFRSGYVALVGRPNVGKSTLLNRLLQQKISITSHKPQTTRHRILGIKTTPDAQIMYVDTPGIHSAGQKSAINRYMNKTATSALADVDVVLFMIEALKWAPDDETVLRVVKGCKAPVLLLVNKIDQLKDKSALLPFIDSIATKNDFVQIIPISASKGDSVDHLESAVRTLLPLGTAYFPADQITDRSQRFLAAELVREKLMRSLGQELPYVLTVEIEEFKQQDQVLHISAVIWVERDGQKAIVIGKQGAQLKRIGELARKDMEVAFDSRVYLRLWVKVKQGWSNDERALRSLGYQDEP